MDEVCVPLSSVADTLPVFGAGQVALAVNKVPAVRLLSAADPGATLPNPPPLNVMVSPFSTTGFIAAPFVFWLTSAVNVWVWPSARVALAGSNRRSIRGSASNVPLPVWHPAALGKPSHCHQLFSTLAVPPVCAMPEPDGAVLFTIRFRLAISDPLLTNNAPPATVALLPLIVQLVIVVN